MRAGGLWPLAPLFALLALIGAGPTLVARHAHESENVRILISVDLADVTDLARSSGEDPVRVLDAFRQAGASACITTTHTLVDLERLGAVSMTPSANLRSTSVLVKDLLDPYGVKSFLERLLGNRVHSTGAGADLRLEVPGTGALLSSLKVFTDQRLLARGRETGLVPIHRLNSAALGGTAYYPAVVDRVGLDEWVVFDEKQALGWPHQVAEVARLLTARRAKICQVEFAGQVGVKEILVKGHRPSALLHSIGVEELSKLPLGRVMARWRRAVRERNNRILVVHPFGAGHLPYAGLDVLEANLRYVSELSQQLAAEHWTTGEPVTGEALGARVETPLLVRLRTAGALAGVILVLAWMGYLMGLIPPSVMGWAVGVGALASLAAPTSWGQLAATALAVLTPGVSTLAAYRALIDGGPPSASLSPVSGPGPRREWGAGLGRAAVIALGMLVTNLAGGALLSAALSIPAYVMRLEEFRGVKLVYLFAPAAAVAFHLWHFRLRPMSRAITVRDGFLVGLVALAGLVYVVRSGNTVAPALTGALEYVVRDSVEASLDARPRTKEFLIGYPCLVMLGFALRWRDRLWAPILLLGVAVGSVSTVNTFCHLHTPPTLSLLRGLLALGPGLLIGALAAWWYRVFAFQPDRPRVTLSGYFGAGNFGDDLILVRAVTWLRRALGDHWIITVVGRPHRPRSLGLEGVEWVDRLRPLAVLEALRTSQVHVSLGGSLFQDVTGPLGSLYYAAFIVLARLCMVDRILVMAQGMGPLSCPGTRWLVAHQLAGADLVMTRDAGSTQTLARWGYPEHGRAVLTGVDMACWERATQAPYRETAGVLGVSLRPVPGVTSLESSRLLAPVIKGVVDLARSRGLSLHLLVCQEDQDAVPLEELARQAQGVSVLRVVLDPGHASMQFAALDLVIGMRYHALLCAVLAGVPAFPISYDPKTDTLLADSLGATRVLHGLSVGPHAAPRAGSLTVDEALTSWVADRRTQRELMTAASLALHDRARGARILAERVLYASQAIDSARIETWKPSGA